MFIFGLSNENATPVEVFFDDLKVTQIKSAVVQTDDYYPFGLTFNSYHRENSVPNQFQYNDKEKYDELGIGWVDYGARMYMPEIGRWGGIDPKADKFYAWSPYAYVLDNPVNLIDPDGKQAFAPVLRFLLGSGNGNLSSSESKWGHLCKER